MIAGMYRCVGRSLSIYSGHHIDGTLLCHLSPADVSALADPTARLSHNLSRVGRRSHCNGSHGHLSETTSHADWRTQMRRNLEQPVFGKGILRAVRAHTV